MASRPSETGTADDAEQSSPAPIRTGRYTISPPAEPLSDNPFAWQVQELRQSIESVWPALATRLHLALRHVAQTRRPFHFEHRYWTGRVPRVNHVSISPGTPAPGRTQAPRELLEISIDAPVTTFSDPDGLLQKVIIEHAHDVFLVTDAEPISAPGPRIIFCNPAVAAATGYTPEELIGQSPRILQGPLTDRNTLDYLRDRLENWMSVRVELQNYRKDGTSFWVEIDVHPVKDETGWWIYWVSVQRDITVRKQNDLCRIGHAGILRQIAAAGPLGPTLQSIAMLIESLCTGIFASILLFDPDSQTLRHGAAPQLPASWVSLIEGITIGPDVGSCGTAAYLHRPVEVDDIANSPVWPEPYRSAALDNNLRACWSTPILNQSGELLGTFALYATSPRSIQPAELRALDSCIELASIAIEGDRTRSESAEQRHRYLHLFHRTPQAMMLFNTTQHRFSLCNTAAQALYGYTAHEFYWLGLKDLFTGPYAGQALQVLLDRPASDAHPPVVWNHRRKDGSPIDVEIDWEFLPWESPDTLLIFVTDVTRREHALQLAGISRDAAPPPPTGTLSSEPL